MDINDVNQQMQIAIQVLQDDIATIRVGRATPSLIEDIVVPAYGGTQQLKVMELASIHVADTQSLTVKPWDKTVIGEIAKAVNNASLGVSAVIDNDTLHVQVPAVTEERRREMIKLLKTKIEHAKVELRQIRHKKLSETKEQFENKELNEDEKFNMEKELQKVIDEYVEKVDELNKKKENELKLPT